MSAPAASRFVELGDHSRSDRAVLDGTTGSGDRSSGGDRSSAPRRSPGPTSSLHPPVRGSLKSPLSASPLAEIIPVHAADPRRASVPPGGACIPEAAVHASGSHPPAVVGRSSAPGASPAQSTPGEAYQFPPRRPSVPAVLQSHPASEGWDAASVAGVTEDMSASGTFRVQAKSSFGRADRTASGAPEVSFDLSMRSASPGRRGSDASGLNHELNSPRSSVLASTHSHGSPISSPRTGASIGSPVGFNQTARTNQSRQLGMRARTFRTEAEVLEEECGDLDGLLEEVVHQGQRELGLTGFKFAELPDKVYECESCEKLTAQSCGLCTLSENISQLQNLVFLDLAHNELSTLPQTLGTLYSLTHLDISHNRITEIPDTIGDLEELQHINLDYNDLDGVPALTILSRIEDLEKCFLVHNPRVSSIPGALAGWRGCQLSVTNSPQLAASWKEHGDRLTGVTIAWDKTYPDAITEHVFCGSLRTTQNVDVLRHLGIDRILTAGSKLKVPQHEGVEQFVVSVDDNPDQKLYPFFEQCSDWIDSLIADGHKVLVHCFMGLSRSCTVICAWLMRSQKLTFKGAMEHMKRGRPLANPNHGFRKQLIEYEERLYGTRLAPDDIENFPNGPTVDPAQPMGSPAMGPAGSPSRCPSSRRSSFRPPAESRAARRRTSASGVVFDVGPPAACAALVRDGLFNPSGSASSSRCGSVTYMNEWQSGMVVRVTADVATARRRQSTWQDMMDVCAGQDGIVVKNLDEDGVICRVGGREWIFAHANLTRLDGSVGGGRVRADLPPRQASATAAWMHEGMEAEVPYAASFRTFATSGQSIAASFRSGRAAQLPAVLVPNSAGTVPVSPGRGGAAAARSSIDACFDIGAQLASVGELRDRVVELARRIDDMVRSADEQRATHAEQMLVAIGHAEQLRLQSTELDVVRRRVSDAEQRLAEDELRRSEDRELIAGLRRAAAELRQRAEDAERAQREDRAALGTLREHSAIFASSNPRILQPHLQGTTGWSFSSPTSDCCDLPLPPRRRGGPALGLLVAELGYAAEPDAGETSSRAGTSPCARAPPPEPPHPFPDAAGPCADAPPRWGGECGGPAQPPAPPAAGPGARRGGAAVAASPARPQRRDASPYACLSPPRALWIGGRPHLPS